MMTRGFPVRLDLLAVVASSVVLQLSCEQLPSGPGHASETALRGITLAEWSPDGYSAAEADGAIARIRSLGSTHVMLLTTAYQDTRSSSTVEVDSSLTPSLSSLWHAASAAAAQGLLLAVKPHVDVRDGTGRSSIDPDDPSRWFDSYRDYLLPLVQFAESAGAVQFVVGTELGHTLHYEAEWESTIAMVRSHFSGAIVYAASWDECAVVPFWDKVDLVGIDAYFPITRRRDAGRLEIMAGWQMWLDRMERLHRKTGKPILITELGYRSVDGAGMSPFDFQSTGDPDPGEQADLYWGAIEAMGHAQWIEGMYWWNVQPAGPVDSHNTEYSPLGKPAEEELRRSWSSP